MSSSCNLALITRQTFFLLEVPEPKRIQMLFWDKLVGDLTQQAVFFVLCISLTNLNAFSDDVGIAMISSREFVCAILLSEIG